MSDLRITGALVMTGPEWRPTPLDLLIRDGRIAETAAPGSLGGRGVTTWEADGRLILPGLVNAHTHSHAMVARGAARYWTLEASLLHGGWMSAPRSAELAELSAVLAATEMIATGATGAFDLSAQAGGPDVPTLLATARGYQRVGLRTVLAPMVADRTVYEAVPAIGECCGVPGSSGLGAAEIVDRCAGFAAAVTDPAGDLGLITPAVAPTIPTHCTTELVQSLHALGLRMQVHLAESRPQAEAGWERFEQSLTAELGRIGVLDDRFTGAHAIWLDDEDRVRLARAGAVVVAVPGSNLRLGSGLADTPSAWAAGLQVAVGTDGANSADALDVLDAARLTMLLPRLVEADPTRWPRIEQVLDAATTGGAAACGWSDVGRIEPGYAADLIAFDLSSSAFTPAHDLPHQVLSAARAGDVTDVMIAGRHVYRDRRFPGLDVAALRRRFTELVTEWGAGAEPARQTAEKDVAAARAVITRLRSGTDTRSAPGA